MTTLIKDSKSYVRVNKPEKFGMHPETVRRLTSLGIDPATFKDTLNVVQGRTRQPARERVRARMAELAANAAPGGRFLSLSLDPNDVRVTPLLDQQALMYEANNFVADVVAPVQLTSERAAKYKIWDRAGFRSIIDARIGPTGSAPEVSPTLSEDNYSVVLRALKSFAENDTDQANPSLQVGLMCVEEVMELHYEGREYDVAQAFHTTGNYPSANVQTLTTGSGGTNWKQGSAADPINDMLTMQEAIPGPMTHVVASDIVWHTAQKNSQLKAILASQLTNKGLLTPMDFSIYFGIPNMVITQADYRDSTGARKRLWSETGLWMGSVNAGMNKRTFCRTFRLNQGAGGWITKRWRDEDRGGDGGVWVRTAYSEDRKIVSSDYGAIIVNVVG